MNTIEYSILLNICFILFCITLEKSSKNTKTFFCILPIAFNMINLFYYLKGWPWSEGLGPTSVDNIKIFFFLFWPMIFLSRINGVFDSSLFYASSLLSFISFFKNDYLFVNLLISVITIFYMKNQNSIDRVKSIPIFVLLMILTQFFFLNTVDKNQLNVESYSFLLNNEAFVLTNLSIYIIIIPLVLYFLASIENQNSVVRYFLKLALVILMIRLSIIIPHHAFSLEMAYAIIFLSILVIMSFMTFDMTLYFISISFAFMMDRSTVDFLPFYYIVAFIIGESINILRSKYLSLVSLLGGLLLLPYTNPYVKQIFMNLSEIPIVLAILFILYYAKMLSFTFIPRELKQ